MRVMEDIVYVRQAAGIKHMDAGAGKVGNAGEDADRLEGLGLRGAAAAGHRGVGIRDRLRRWS